jgi:signal transduction histidine kinase/CheY-like chemotaxis protein
MTTDDLFAPFGLAVFEQLTGGLFRAVGLLPDWLELSSAQSEIDLTDRFPMIELFLPQCAAVWDAGAPKHIRSDAWTEPNPQGGELYLQAVATAAGGRRFIALASLPQALFTYQQLAHDVELEKEKVQRLSIELEAKREEAERATHAKSDFLATMSHEIRTPLSAIIGMADVLSFTQLTVDQQKCVDVSQRNGVALLNLINDILDLSKVEAGRIELELVDMDLRDILARSVEVVEARANAKGLSLSWTVAPDIPRYLIGDANRLRQIIVNLLGNSTKFTERGGIEVKAEPDPENTIPGHLRFSIADTGIGIPEEKLGLIFGAFSQADSSTTRRYGGTGLGLNISKHLVELMGGRIWVESKVGVGTTFFFTADFQVPSDQSERSGRDPQREVVAELGVVTAALRVLLVDDSEDIQFLIRGYLKGSPITVVTAEDGQIGVDLFQTGRFDAVLMDVNMPVMDGYQAVREIRRIENETGASPTPVFAFTADAFADTVARATEAGFTGALTKPIRRATLIEALAALGGSATPAPIRIQVEEGMEDIVPGYLEKRRAEIKVYRASLARGDFDTIGKLAHKMKGTGSGYGFPRLTELGEVLEKAAIQSDAFAAREKLEELTLYLERVELEYLH